jgi:hypothetical protein
MDWCNLPQDIQGLVLKDSIDSMGFIGRSAITCRSLASQMAILRKHTSSCYAFADHLYELYWQEQQKKYTMKTLVVADIANVLFVTSRKMVGLKAAGHIPHDERITEAAHQLFVKYGREVLWLGVLGHSANTPPWMVNRMIGLGWRDCRKDPHTEELKLYEHLRNWLYTYAQNVNWTHVNS